MKKPLKICANPDCKDEIVEYKSSKRKYCNNSCRNHHGHKRRSEENLEFEIYKRGLAKNYAVLKLHKDADITFESFEKYQKFGFNTLYLPAKKTYRDNGNIFEYYEIKDIKFRLESTTENIIIINKYFKI